MFEDLFDTLPTSSVPVVLIRGGTIKENIVACLVIHNNELDKSISKTFLHERNKCTAFHRCYSTIFIIPWLLVQVKLIKPSLCHTGVDMLLKMELTQMLA